MTTPTQSISRLLPQTQCRKCGYEGCLPYARALSAGEVPVNLCAPGGETVMRDPADLLGKPCLAPAKMQIKVVVLIDESACIGCIACIRACPADVIMGVPRLMYTVISDECTGCGLCVTPGPVDCIDMVPVLQPFLSSARHFSTSAELRFAAAERAQSRLERHIVRKQRDDAEREALLAQCEAVVKAKQAIQAQTRIAAPSAAFDPMNLTAKVMAKAQLQQNKLIASDNREDFKARQIKEAKERAELRRVQRDAKYGGEAEKAAAIEFLCRHKAKQEVVKETR